MMGPRPKHLAERLFTKVKITDSCWIWTGSCTSNGYGHLSRGGAGDGMLLAHRAVYEVLVGPIPEGLELDHLCRTTACVNPDHLEPVTSRENLMRSSNPNMAAHLSGVCKRGHPTAEYGRPRKDRTVGFYCRECRRLAKKRTPERTAG